MIIQHILWHKEIDVFVIVAICMMDFSFTIHMQHWKTSFKFNRVRDSRVQGNPKEGVTWDKTCLQIFHIVCFLILGPHQDSRVDFHEQSFVANHSCKDVIAQKSVHHAMVKVDCLQNVFLRIHFCCRLLCRSIGALSFYLSFSGLFLSCTSLSSFHLSCFLLLLALILLLRW